MKINAIISLAIPGNLHEHLFVTVGTALICEGAQEKVLGVIIDKNLNLLSNYPPYEKRLAKKQSV